MKYFTKSIITSMLLTCSFGAMADEPEKSPFSLTGYLDVSYNYLSGNGLFINDVPNRVFDRKENGFTFHNFDLTTSYLPTDGFGALLNINFGDDADVFGAADTDLADNFDVQAVYVQYARGPFTAIAGKYVTLAGAEVIKSPNDVNFSRSILFGYAIPFTHTGGRVSYALNDKATLYAGVNRGWDVAGDDNNSSETLELAVSLIPSDSFSLFIDGYSGDEPGAVGSDTRNLIDAVATLAVSEKLSLVLNVDWATQDNALAPGSDADWSGVAGYVNYKFNDQWRLSLRGEFFDDADGFRTGITQEWKEATVTVAYLPTDSLEFRGEVRGDWSDVDSFQDDDGNAEDNQYSFGLEAIYKFGL